ncbi:MAG: hypothetical protein M3279_06995 [Actinomycetota bacterium]|nr:hypothetical protein [Actinomycetota bacterium]
MKRHLAATLLLLLLGMFLVVPAPAFACHDSVSSPDPLITHTCEQTVHPPIEEEIEHLEETAANLAFFVFCTVFPDHPACQA